MSKICVIKGCGRVASFDCDPNYPLCDGHLTKKLKQEKIQADVQKDILAGERG